jgi:hypothetical protein
MLTVMTDEFKARISKSLCFHGPYYERKHCPGSDAAAMSKKQKLDS